MDLRRKLRAGDRPVGGWCSFPSPSVAEALATAAFDFVTIDTEHAPTTIETVENGIRAVEAAPGPTEPLVRVAEVDATRIARVLDAGAAGVIAPRVNTVEAARELARACRYPSQDADGAPARTDGSEGDADSAVNTGTRGVGLGRASAYGRRIDETVRAANDEVAVIAQIETEEAVENAEAIADVAGIDALLVGPADLSASIGRFRAFDDPAFETAIARTVAAAETAGVPVGTLATSEERIDAWLDAGFDFLIVGTDAGFLVVGADRAIERYEESV